jgi:hypothetical protein
MRIETDETSWKRKKIKAWMIFGIFLVVLGGIYALITLGPRDGGTSRVFRYGFMANEKLWSLLQSERRSPRSSDRQPVGSPRVNGLVGLKTPLVIANYSIEVQQADLTVKYPLSDFYALPKDSQVTEFRCIEGWSEDYQYAGARFSQFMEAYKLGRKSDGSFYAYVGLETPDKKYYVSIDMESMLHPQTLLAWEMNGKPLSVNNGSPLRLMIPIKYGIKSLKRVGKIIFSDQRPRDYWAERGYDWYSGL